ncbi:hypothetical protein H9Q73_000968 [Fusarium xylarioides]|nr:hypothetical protein H9Q73_000968 [Fusarium xylarioides]
MDLPIRSRTFDDDADLDFALNQLAQSTEDDVDEQYDLQDSQNRQMREKWDSIMKEIEKECKKSAPNRQWEPLILKMRDEESYKDALRGTCNGTGFLHHFVKDTHIARNCPREVATVIVNHNPDSVEHVIDGGDQHPLTFAIKTSCDNLFLSMLTSLSQRGISLLKNDKGEGRQCIRAAFEASRQRCHSSMTIAACKLVGWASESMLSGLKTDDNLTPLQVAVTADQSYFNGNVQLKLVNLLLKLHEPSIHDKVFRGIYKTLWGKVVLQEDISVYEWHQRTLDLFRKDQITAQQSSTLNYDRNRQSNTTSQRQGQKMNGGSTSTSGMPTSDTNRGKPGQNKQPDSPPMTAALNTEKKEMSRNNVSGLAKQPGSSQASHEKPTISGQFVMQTRPRKQPFHQAINNPNVEETSKKIKNELQEHYLRCIILTPPGEDNAAVTDQDESEIKQFFGNDMQDVEIGLDLGNQPHGEPLTEASIRRFFKDTKFNSVLAYVSLPQAPLKLTPQSNKKFQAPRFSDDRLFYFHWLHNEKKVDKILKLIVNDTKQPHRDEVIEEAVGGKSSSKDGLQHDFKVEILKWHKVDLDPTTIGVAAPNVRELHLDWSGNNVALLG